MLQIFSANQWENYFSNSIQHQAINQLEKGQILHFPELAFNMQLQEAFLLSPDYISPEVKNISYSIHNNQLSGISGLSVVQHQYLIDMMKRFSQNAFKLVKSLFPSYMGELIIARTSFRPVEIDGRITSYRKDDKRLHVDAFPASPNQGKRILRVFSNINPKGEPRVWRVGEPFEKVANRFLPKIRKPFPGKSHLLKQFRITKSYRTLYDHYMLHMHDLMKADIQYQQMAEQREIAFPSGSTWIVQTDHVSHAAMRGQYLLEQTFYLPVHAMNNPEYSPLRVMEKMLGRSLVT